MTNKKVSIGIRGPNHSGKTNIGLAIADALSKLGLHVRFHNNEMRAEHVADVVRAVRTPGYSLASLPTDVEIIDIVEGLDHTPLVVTFGAQGEVSAPDGAPDGFKPHKKHVISFCKNPPPPLSLYGSAENYKVATDPVFDLPEGQGPESEYPAATTGDGLVGYGYSIGADVGDTELSKRIKEAAAKLPALELDNAMTDVLRGMQEPSALRRHLTETPTHLTLLLKDSLTLLSYLDEARVPDRDLLHSTLEKLEKAAVGDSSGNVYHMRKGLEGIRVRDDALRVAGAYATKLVGLLQQAVPLMDKLGTIDTVPSTFAEVEELIGKIKAAVPKDPIEMPASPLELTDDQLKMNQLRFFLIDARKIFQDKGFADSADTLTKLIDQIAK